MNKTVGGSIPGNFIPAILKGINEGMMAGSVAGYPVQGINIEVYDGSFHDVDSSEIAFKIAGRGALRDGMSKARPVLLEPIMKLKITIPEAFMGAIMAGTCRISVDACSAWRLRKACRSSQRKCHGRALQVRR